MSGRLAAVVWVLALALPVIAGSRPSVENGELRFDLHDLDGRPVGADDPRFADRVVLVDLWATWCPPCLSEIPTLVDLESRYGDRGLTIVGIAFEAEDDPELRRRHLREFAKERGINYLVLDGGVPEGLDTALPTVRGVRGFPVEIVIDRDGRVVDARNGYGYKKRWARRLERELVELLETPAADD